MSDNPGLGRPIPRGSLQVIGCVIAAVAVGMTLRAAPARPDAAWVVPWLWAWGGLALWAAWAAHRPGGLRLRPGGLILLAVAVRLPLVGVPLHLSDDVYRYLWEGEVLAHGLNPFVSAPDTISGLDDALRARVNHPSIPSIYPPIALLWFRLLAGIGLGAIGAQVAGLLCDLGSVWAISRYLQARGRPMWPALLFVLHPLVAVEGTAGAHLESPAIFLALLGLATGAGGLFTGLAAGFKLVPLFWWPATWNDRRGVLGAALASVLWIVAVLPVLSAGPALFTAWRRYASEWRFNGLLFPILDPITGGHARAVLLFLAIAAAIWALRGREPEVVWLRIGGAFVLLSPTVHPWYVLWALIPSLLVARWEWAIVSVFLQGSYLVLATLRPDGRWSEGPWLWAITWGPAVGATIFGWSRRQISGRVPVGGRG